MDTIKLPKITQLETLELEFKHRQHNSSVLTSKVPLPRVKKGIGEGRKNVS
jgi:hypothetical protein